PPPPELILLLDRTLSRPELALSDDRNDRHDERNDSRREDPCSRVEPQRSQNPAPPDAPDETERDVPAQSVASALHNPPGQQAGQQPRENPRQESHDSFSFIWLQIAHLVTDRSHPVPIPSHASRPLATHVHRTGEIAAASAPERPSADRRFVAPEGARAFRSPARRVT